MGKKLIRFISLTLSVIILSSCILFSNISTVNAVSIKCGISITDGIYGNLSEASLPQGVHEFYTDDSPIFIFAVDADLRITKLDLYIYRGGSLYGHKSAPINNYIRFWNMTDYSSLPSGSYTYKYVYNIDGYNTANSGEIAFTVYDKPYITSSPSSKQVKSGNVASFSVSASGGKTSSYSYKWYYSTTSSGSGTSISGATSSTYSVSASSSNSGRYYYCVVSDGKRSVTSSRALLTTTYTISYNANGGSGAPSSQTKLHGKTLTLSSVKPTRTGYTFLGWSTSSSATSASYSSGGSFSQNANKTLYAVWKDNTLPSGSITSTNDISNSQTVTLKFSDNVGIAGYYWGTSSSYSNNTYTSTSSTSVSKSISEPGTYYLTVKDTSGNVSASQFITFYRTTLNGNGTTLSTTSVLTKRGNSFTPEDPTRNGYEFIGWSTSKNASICYASIIPNSNTTYYAVWKDTTPPFFSIASTNYISNSQTVTLKFNDNEGIAGYYWGTSSSYSNNTYTSTSSTSVSKSISKPGTYYLTVKDTSGNVSSSKSITFYETKLNANGGTVYPTSVLTMSGNSFYLPTPTRNGYTFTGWSTNELATGGEKYSITPNCSNTYFAIWKMDEALDQTISLPSTSYTKTYGDKPFNLNANAKTNLQYSSSNTFVVDVSSAGTVTIKGSGSATITITAISDEQYNSAVKTVKITVNKATQTITAKSYTKTYGSKAFSLGAKSSGDGKLTYSSSDKRVVTVSSMGVVTVKGCGRATITINASATSKYKSASKKITITVKPVKLKIKTFRGNKKVLKIYYTKQNNADGYQCVYSQGSRKITTTSKKDYVTIKNLTKGSYVVKIRAYKKISGTLVYGEFGKIQLTVG